MVKDLGRGEVRILRADRRQIGFEMIDIEALLVSGHQARLVWSFVESLSLEDFYAKIKSVEGEAGRPAADPAVLLALWLYATIEGVGSARELARLVGRDVAYRWLAGGVAVNYHGLSDFRVDHGEVLDKLLTQSVAALMTDGLVKFEEVLIDGTKIKASAGAGSFGRKDRMQRIEKIAGERVAQLKTELESDPEASVRRKKAAQLRAATELGERAAKALKVLKQLQEEKEQRALTHKTEEDEKPEPRASLSDPEARIMRFPDRSFKPGYNVQIVADASGLVLAVEATDRRNDTGLAKPMVEQLVKRYGKLPQRLLADSQYATAEDILALATDARGKVEVYSPEAFERPDVKPETLRKRQVQKLQEPQALKDWRARMGTSLGQEIYRRRKRIELVNAHIKNRGFGLLALRGLAKVKITALLHALANNITLAHHLRQQPA